MPNYTYDDFTRAADAAGLTGSFDASDLTTAQKFPEYGLSLVSLKRDMGNAQTAEQRLLATEAMNQLRKNYGSYGVGTGADRSYATSYGSRINQALDNIGSYAPYSSAYGEQISKTLSDIGNYGDFAYSQDSAYKDILDKIINQQSFSYDTSTDPIFSSYKKAYNREGDRAAANALAAASAATGGRASSYANMAAQQANNYYAGKLADVIPTLRSQALSEYNNQYDQLLRQMNTMASDRNSEYQLYLDRLSQMQQNLQNLQRQDATEYGRYENTLAQLQQDLENLQRQDATDYNRYLDELNAAYQRERDAAADKQNEFDNALKVFQATGQITGALADYLGGGSTYAGAAATYTGGGYGGSRSGNALTAAEKQDQAVIDALQAKYPDGVFTDASDWQTMHDLGEKYGWTTQDMINSGIHLRTPSANAYQDEQDALLAAAKARQAAAAYQDEQDALLAATKAQQTQPTNKETLGNILKQVVQQAATAAATAEANPYAGYYTDPVTNANAAAAPKQAATNAATNALSTLGNALKQAVTTAAAATTKPYTNTTSKATTTSSSTKKGNGGR